MILRSLLPPPPQAAASATSRKFAALLVAAVGLYPVFWLLGLGGFFMVFLAVPSGIYLLRVRLGGPGLLALAVGATIAISIPFGLAAFDFDLLRLLSAGANISVWVVIAAVLTVASQVDLTGRLRAALAIAVVAQAVLIVISAIVYPATLPLPITANLADSLPSGLRAFARNDLFDPAWFGGPAFRTSGIFGNPTWAGAVASLMVLVILTTPSKRVEKWILVVPLIGGIVATYFALSRTSYLLLAIGLILIPVLALRRRRPKLFVIVASSTTASLAVLAVIFRGPLLEVLSQVDGARTGSSRSRGEVYAQSWEHYLQHAFPLLGYGIKPQEPELVASLGSLSTYVGLLFRAGVLGVVLFLALLGVLATICLKNHSTAGFIVVVFVALWAVIGDVDAGHFVPLFLAFCIPPPGPDPGNGVTDAPQQGASIADADADA